MSKSKEFWINQELWIMMNQSMNKSREFTWEFSSPKNVNKTYFDSLKLSHCNFKAVKL